MDVESDNKLVGKTIDSLEVWKDSGIHILALWESGSKIYIPWRKTTFKKGQTLAIFGEEDQLKKFTTSFNLKIKDHLNVFAELQDDKEAGFAEIILPPDSSLKGKSIEEIALRKDRKSVV